MPLHFLELGRRMLLSVAVAAASAVCCCCCGVCCLLLLLRRLLLSVAVTAASVVCCCCCGVCCCLLLLLRRLLSVAVGLSRCSPGLIGRPRLGLSGQLTFRQQTVPHVSGACQAVGRYPLLPATNPLPPPSTHQQPMSSSPGSPVSRPPRTPAPGSNVHGVDGCQDNVISEVCAQLTATHRSLTPH